MDRSETRKSAVSTDFGSIGAFFIVWYWLSFFLLMFFGFCTTTSGYIDVPKSGGKPLELVGVPGDTIRLTLFKDDSYGANWSTSDGFSMKLANRELDYETTRSILSPGARCSRECESEFVVPTATPDIKATVQAQVQATVEAVPTAIPTPEPRATLIPTPTAIPTPTPRPTPTPTLAPLPVVLPTPSPTIDVAVYIEYDAWISGFGDRMVFNIEHFTQRVFEQPQGDYWRSRMEEIATTFIDGHKEAAEINAPPLFEPAHAKFVEGLASYAALGSLLRTWINSGSALTEQQLAAWIQMLENGQSLLYEAADLMPVVEGYEAINVDAAGSINLEGRGQQASSKFNLGEGLAIFKMTHNGSSNFSIWLLDNRGGSIELLVNEIGSFNGSKAVQIEVAGVYLLDISADGRWTVKIEQ